MTKTTGFHYGYVVAGCCLLMTLFHVGLVLSCAGIFFGPVSAELGVPAGRMGLFVSFNFIFSAITLTFAGKLMDRFGARLLITLASAALGLCLLAMSRFTALWQFYLAGALSGATFAFLLYLGFPILVPRWFKRRVGLFIGICSAGSGIGGALFNPLCGRLITAFGWRAAYLAFGLVILCVITPTLGIFLRNDPADLGLKPYGETDETEQAPDAALKTPPAEPEGPEYREVVRMPMFYGLFLFAFLMNAVAPLFQYIPAYAGTLHFTLEQASFAASAAMVGVTVGKVGLGIINDRSIRLGLLATTGLGIAGLALLLIGHWGAATLVCGGFLFGWAYAGVTVQTPLLVRTVFGARSFAQVYANISIAFTVAGAAAMAVWGFLAEKAGYRLVLVCGIVLLLICAAIGFAALAGGRRQA